VCSAICLPEARLGSKIVVRSTSFQSAVNFEVRQYGRMIVVKYAGGYVAQRCCQSKRRVNAVRSL
jgi:hypothetical protein